MLRPFHQATSNHYHARPPPARGLGVTTWPASVSERVRAIREVLAGQSEAVTPETLAKEFHRARAADLRDILETLVSLGQARQQGNAFQL